MSWLVVLVCLPGVGQAQQSGITYDDLVGLDFANSGRLAHGIAPEPGASKFNAIVYLYNSIVWQTRAYAVGEPGGAPPSPKAQARAACARLELSPQLINRYVDQYVAQYPEERRAPVARTITAIVFFSCPGPHPAWAHPFTPK